MGAHALLAASSSYRWLNCTPSAVMERGFPDETSAYAAEGTAAHALAEYKLCQFLKIPATRPVSEYDSPELEEFTDAYVAYACELIAEARSKSADARVLIEQKLDFSHYVPGGFGTGDLIVVADGILSVADLKYGKGVLVSAERNTQMMLYGLGALALYDCLYNIHTVRMTICQPRLDNISTYEMSVDELLNWAETELKPKATIAAKGEGEYVAGPHCRFCRARRTCRARAEVGLELVKLDFKLPAFLTDDEISEVLSKAAVISAWAEDVKEFALTQAVNHGKKWPGFKLVEGKSNRKYSDEAKVSEALLASGVYSENDIYAKELLGITALEKLMGKKQFASLLGAFIEKPAGKPALVAISDKRPELSALDTAISDFT